MNLSLLNSKLIALNFQFNDAPSGLQSRPNLPFLVPNHRAPNGHGALEVSPNGLESNPSPLCDVSNDLESKQLLDREVPHKLPPEVQVV